MPFDKPPRPFTLTGHFSAAIRSGKRHSPASPHSPASVKVAPMHELSIAQSLIDTACEEAQRAGASRVCRISLRIGALAGVVKEALQFSFELAAEGTLCEGAELDIEDVALTVMCPACNAPRTLPQAWHFSCPDCGAPASEILTGRELDLVSLEIEQHAPAHP